MVAKVQALDLSAADNICCNTSLDSSPAPEVDGAGRGLSVRVSSTGTGLWALSGVGVTLLPEEAWLGRREDTADRVCISWTALMVGVSLFSPSLASDWLVASSRGVKHNRACGLMVMVPLDETTPMDGGED